MIAKADSLACKFIVMQEKTMAPFLALNDKPFFPPPLSPRFLFVTSFDSVVFAWFPRVVRLSHLPREAQNTPAPLWPKKDPTNLETLIFFIPFAACCRSCADSQLGGFYIIRL